MTRYLKETTGNLGENEERGYVRMLNENEGKENKEKKNRKLVLKLS